jgi:RNA polymerase-interacting CarD/CdnL/TRCF family regulator
VKALRRARTDENLRDYESRFYRAAKRVLTEEQLATVRLATEGC